MEKISEIKHSSSFGSQAFIAMRFGDEELDCLLENYIRKSVKETGFSLMRLDDRPKAGSIDDRLRVETRRSRFVLADLTHANLGAYWEAGFAEGAGKPVIYLCKKEIFDDHKTKPHFDTKHHLTVLWDCNDYVSFSQKLKDTIRATIPEALQSDQVFMS